MRNILTLLTSARCCSVALAPAAIAQTAAPQPASSQPTVDSQDIVVTGFRASLASAIQQKRAAPAIVDTISAEDIGKFPEQNLAESLQRINGTYRQPTVDRTKEVKVDTRYDFERSFLKSIRFGAQLGRRQQDVTSQQLVVSAHQLAPLLGLPYSPTIEGGSFAAGAFMQSYSFPNFLGAYHGSATFPTSFLSSDPRLVFAQVPLEQLATQFPATQNKAQSYSVREDTMAGYARADFGSGDGRLAGNVGVRVVRTKQTSDGFAPDFSLIRFDQQGARTIVPSVTATSVKQNYTNVLPSLNLRYKLTDNFDLRFGAARVLSRPTLSLLAPNTNINANVLTISGGNPTLKPFISDQLDLSAEWYFSRGALLSGAVFYKNVKNYIANYSSSRTLSIQQVQGGTRDFVFTVLQPSNAGSPKIKGFEIGYQQPFSFLPAPLDGFGLIANYTYVKADKISVSTGSAAVALPGVSKNNYNLVAYYEKGPFGARLSYNFRDKFVVDPYSYFGDGQYTKSYAQLDFSSSFKVNDHVEIDFDVLNIGNTPLINVDRYGINGVMKTMAGASRWALASGSDFPTAAVRCVSQRAAALFAGDRMCA